MLTLARVLLRDTELLLLTSEHRRGRTRRHEVMATAQRGRLTWESRDAVSLLRSAPTTTGVMMKPEAKMAKAQAPPTQEAATQQARGGK